MRLQLGPVQHLDMAAAVADDPAFCSLPAASVTPSRRTPSMLAISSCVIISSLPGQPVQAQQQPAAQLLVHRMVAVAYRRLRHLRDQRLRIAQQQVLHRAAAVELLLEHLSPAVDSRRPALCTTARLGVVSPPMNRETPTRPSLPTTAISAEAPFSMT